MQIRSTNENCSYRRISLCVILFTAVLVLPAIRLCASSANERAKTYFDQARAAHSALQKVPMAKRSIDEYTKLVESFRRVYLTAPHYGNSTISLMAIGELSEEMGRRWSEPKYFQQAIDAYGFLLREYPQSQFRFDARLAVARIYRYDLQQPAKALQQFERYVADYPNSAQSRMARLALAQLRDEVGPTTASSDAPAARSKEGALSGKPSADTGAPARLSAAPATPTGTSSLASISDIRYWTNPDTSRVVVDISQLGDRKLTYEAAQLTSPPRLYIDLKDTSIPKPAGGRTLEVNGELLKRVRLAQFDKRVSRLVLDLGADTDYQISEMTNPYRLVIDVHGKVSETEAAIPVAVAPPPPAPAPSSEPPKSAQEVVAAAAPHPKPLEPAAPAALASSVVAEKATEPDPIPAKQEPLLQAAKKEAPSTEVAKEVAAAARPTIGKQQSEAAAPVQLASAVPSKMDRSASEAKPTSGAKSTDAESKPRAAVPTLGGMHSLTRALGLKIGRIFIDAGHGGHDTGTIGPGGLTEKEISLDVAQRLGQLITEKLGSEVIYSRENDTFIPLEGRVALANQAGADLFLSVHLNSSTARNATGIETYYLNFTNDPEALKVAARENSGAQETIANLQGIVRKIALQEKLDESKEFAGRMQASLRKVLARGMTRKAANQFDRGVKTAPFVVLIGADMPSILAEISFLSNPAEEKRLRTSEYRQKLAEALFAGVSSYVDSLSGVKIAPRLAPKPPGTPGKKDSGASAKAQAKNPVGSQDATSPRSDKLGTAQLPQPEDIASLH